MGKYSIQCLDLGLERCGRPDTQPLRVRPQSMWLIRDRRIDHLSRSSERRGGIEAYSRAGQPYPDCADQSQSGHRRADRNRWSAAIDQVFEQALAMLKAQGATLVEFTELEDRDKIAEAEALRQVLHVQFHPIADTCLLVERNEA
jgi:hypothetical protein